jgi:phytoene dehydrogenase-like protein
MARWDVAIIGGGHNGLVAAAYLARAGRSVVVLERRDEVGGCAVTHEIAPGFRAPALAHALAIDPRVAADLGLAGQGLRLIEPPVSVFAPSPTGRAVVVWRDTMRTAHDLAPWSPADAARWPEFVSAATAIAAAVAGLLRQIPPSIDRPDAGELVDLVKNGRALRALGRQGLYRFLRWGPMPIGDLVAESLETPLLRAVLAARGTFGMAAGPRSAGTAASWLLQTALEGHPAGAPRFAVGGPGSLAAALAVAATSAGVEVERGAHVVGIEVEDDGVRGVRLENGSVVEARTVVSNADPKHTLLGLVDAIRLPPSFREKIRRYRARGALAKVNLALARCPGFIGTGHATAPPEELLAGRIHIGPDPDYLERAFDHSKYGEMSAAPWLEVVIPTLTDPTLAPPGQHVMSVYAQWMPYQLRGRGGRARREALGDLVVRTLAGFAPDLPASILAREVLTPLDLEQRYGLTGGHIFHGEHALDQLYAMRPVLDWAQHRTPVRGLYLCGAGTHPGGGLTGTPGAHAAKVVNRHLH